MLRVAQWIVGYNGIFIKQVHLAKQTEIFVKRDGFMSGNSDGLVRNMQFWWFCFCPIVFSLCYISRWFDRSWFAWIRWDSSRHGWGWNSLCKYSAIFSSLCKHSAMLFLIVSWSSRYFVFRILECFANFNEYFEPFYVFLLWSVLFWVLTY